MNQDQEINKMKNDESTVGRSLHAGVDADLFHQLVRRALLWG
jgi:hypothetical protein